MTDGEFRTFVEACDRPAAEVIEARPLPDLSLFEVRRQIWLAEVRQRVDRAIRLDERQQRRRRWLLSERARLRARLDEVAQALRGLHGGR